MSSAHVICSSRNLSSCRTWARLRARAANRRAAFSRNLLGAPGQEELYAGASGEMVPGVGDKERIVLGVVFGGLAEYKSKVA